MKRLMILLVGLMSLSCHPENIEEQNSSMSITLDRLYELADGGYCPIEADWSVEGVVVADDRFGNFSRAVVLADDSHGVELLTGLYDNSRLYPEGAHLIIRLRGLAIDTRGGVVRIGLPSDNSQESSVQPLYHAPLLMRHITHLAHVDKLPTVRWVSCMDYGSLSGCRVVVDSVRSLDTVAVWQGIHSFCTPSHDTLRLRTLPEAHFASDTIPADIISVEGIVYDNEIRVITYKKKDHPAVE